MLAITTEHEVVESPRSGFLELELVEASERTSHFPWELYSSINSHEVFPPWLFPENILSEGGGRGPWKLSAETLLTGNGAEGRYGPRGSAGLLSRTRAHATEAGSFPKHEIP